MKIKGEKIKYVRGKNYNFINCIDCVVYYIFSDDCKLFKLE